MFTRLALLVAALVLVARGPLVNASTQAAPAKGSGVLTLDGMPLAGATITFLPTEAGNKAASAKTDDNGRYKGIEAAAGKYRVTISLVRGDKEIVPAAYSDKEKSSLVVEIKG